MSLVQFGLTQKINSNQNRKYGICVKKARTLPLLFVQKCLGGGSDKINEGSSLLCQDSSITSNNDRAGMQIYASGKLNLKALQDVYNSAHCFALCEEDVLASGG